MNQEILDALNVIYEIVACAYDEVDVDVTPPNDIEAHEKLGEQLGLMFEFTIQAAKYLANQDAEAELLKERNK